MSKTALRSWSGIAFFNKESSKMTISVKTPKEALRVVDGFRVSPLGFINFWKEIKEKPIK